MKFKWTDGVAEPKDLVLERIPHQGETIEADGERREVRHILRVKGGTNPYDVPLLQLGPPKGV
jgi:hypothetical protein